MKSWPSFPWRGTFWPTSGYLTFDAFTRANPNANPLALRAVFDTFSTSTDVVSSLIAQTMLDEYKQDPTTLNQKLLLAKLQGYSAILTLLFLLGLADVVAAGHAYHGWFPDWPGAKTSLLACSMAKLAFRRFHSTGCQINIQ